MQSRTFMEQNFPALTLTLHRFREKHPWYFPPKMDDFWVIERLWAILAAKVYRNPRPTHVDALMRRVRDAVRETKPETLTKLVHEMPARMNKIFEMKGRKIPAGWKARNSQWACKCDVCKWFSICQQVFVNTKWPRRSPTLKYWWSRARQIPQSDCICEVECNYVLYRGIFVLSRIDTRSLRGILYLRGYIGSVTNFNSCFRGVFLIFESFFPKKIDN